MVIGRDHPQSHVRRLPLQDVGDERPHAVDDRGRGRDRHRARTRRGIERLPAQQRRRPGKNRSQRPEQRPRFRGEDAAIAIPDQNVVTQQPTDTTQGVRHRRLRQPHPIRGPGHRLLLQQGEQTDQQVEVGGGEVDRVTIGRDIHEKNITHIVYSLDKSSCGLRRWAQQILPDLTPD